MSEYIYLNPNSYLGIAFSSWAIASGIGLLVINTVVHRSYVGIHFVSIARGRHSRYAAWAAGVREGPRTHIYVLGEPGIVKVRAWPGRFVN